MSYKDPDKQREYHRKWRQANPEKWKAASNKSVKAWRARQPKNPSFGKVVDDNALSKAERECQTNS